MKSSKSVGKLPTLVPILPLRDMVIFPGVVIPLFLKGARVVRLAESLQGGSNLVGLFYQKSRSRFGIWSEELSSIGALARVERIVAVENGGVRAVAEGLCRVRLISKVKNDPFLTADVTLVEEKSSDCEFHDTLITCVTSQFKMAEAMGKTVSRQILKSIEQSSNIGQLADLISAQLSVKAETKQQLLETLDPVVRLRTSLEYLKTDIEDFVCKPLVSTEPLSPTMSFKRPAESETQQRFKTFQKDFSADDDPHMTELKSFQRKVRETGMPPDVAESVTREIQRLERIPPHSPEHIVSRTYLDVLTSLPWDRGTSDHLDLEKAQKTLDQDHYDLAVVKERIMEFLAVRKLKADNKGPILCLVGPPGVGKTSLGRSIARAMGRKFARISLGGVRDEAEIRGHRRTYIGAMPGRIIQEIRRAGTNNPVFVLDEIDKVGQDSRGDPASALLEALDPEQNSSFMDHYVDLPFDLSKVMFIATANQVDNIPKPLRDRMEIIRISGYTDEEKEKIAELFLIPKAQEQNGIKDYKIVFDPAATRKLICGYTREAGVRNLEREIHSVCRKIALKITQGQTVKDLIDPFMIEDLLGVRKFHSELADQIDRIGVATGLAWTENGGEIIFIEVTNFGGRTGLILTGNMGEVMQESARAALSYLRHSCESLGLERKSFSDTELHVHVPSAAIPKDGPSAGVTIAVALASLFTGMAVRRDVAMTGELTLHGRILPVGGIKEKLLAAKRAGVKEIILPAKNFPDVRSFQDHITEGLILHFVSEVGEAIDVALTQDLRIPQFSMDRQKMLPLFSDCRPKMC
ncbi:MAG: endopeptidase La [Deltaproteobacteria bacterium]|nr:endopeptidase La [Deltaproteobacteria bacterium]